MADPVLFALLRLITLSTLIAASLALGGRSRWAIPLTLAGLAGAALPWCRAWRAARGTALRPALVWAAIALGLAMASQVVALGETPESGRPTAGQVVYLASLAGLAALISVLNARTPGGGAWAILMGLLVVVFLVPWLEGSGLVREGGGWDRLRLTAPWTIFYGLVVVAGVTNFLPTRLKAASVGLGIAFVAEYLALTRLDRPHEVRGLSWTFVPLVWAWSAWSAEVETRHPDRHAPPGLGRLWAWFRDAWGVVWALRVQERFNRAAESAGWTVRLTWHGVVSTTAGPPEIPPEAAALLTALLRRFATADRLERAAR